MRQSLGRAMARQKLLSLGVFALLFSLALGFGPKPSPLHQTETVLQARLLDAAAPDPKLRTAEYGVSPRSASSDLAAEPLAEYFRSPDVARQTYRRMGRRARSISSVVYGVTPDQSTGTVRLTATGPSAEINEALLRELVGVYEEARGGAQAGADRAPAAQEPFGNAAPDRSSLDTRQRSPVLVSGPDSRLIRRQMSWEVVFLAAVLSGALAMLAAVAADRRR